MKLSASVLHQLIKRAEVVIDGFPGFEAIDNFRANIRTAADGRGIAENLGRLLYRFDDLSFSRRAIFFTFCSQSRQGTGTNERARPRAKIFGAEALAH